MKTKITLILFLNILLYACCNNTNSGQYFVLTLPNYKKTKNIGTWLQKTKPAGVMLMQHHVQNKQQTKKLCSYLQNKAKELKIYPLLICIDWEGGIVSRPNESGNFVSTPSPYNLTKAGRDSCFKAGMLIGQQLKEIGINLNFAPSLDLFHPKNYILATRCFSSDPKVVTENGIAFAKGLISQGITPVIKHYPGLMLGKSDSHFSKVNINSNQKEFDKNEKPFITALQEKIPAIMISHAQYSQLGHTPASRNKNVIKKLKKINPNIITITDDIFMKAYHRDLDLSQAVKESIGAGIDLFICTLSPKKQIELIQKLDKQLKENKKNKSIAILKKKLLTNKNVNNILDTEKTSFDLAQKTLNQKISSIDFKNKKILLLTGDLPKIRPTEKWFTKRNKSYFHDLLKSENINCQEIIFDATKDLKKLKNLNNYDYIILQTFFYGDGVWNTNQKQLLKNLKPYQTKIITLSLGHPYEKLILPKAQNLELGSFHKPIIKAAFKKLTTKPCITGAQKLAQNPTKYLDNKKFGLLCHKSSVVNTNNKTKHLVDVLYNWTKQKDSKSKLCALFAPEHGLLGSQEAGAIIKSDNKSKWDCPIYSLHGLTKKPDPKQLQNLDLLVVDLQDIGVRCYTYLSTLKLILDQAKKCNLPILLLERPNPLKLEAQGPELKKGFESFFGKVYVPFIYQKTMAQIMQELNKQINCDLTILKCDANKKLINNHFVSNYIPPSPNLISLDSIYAYPATVFIEGTNYSEGRGTLHPFEQIGAPWVNKKTLAKNLNRKKLPGIYFEPISFVPTKIPGLSENPKHKKVTCNGVYLHILDYKKYAPIKTAQTILQELFKSYPKKSVWLKSRSRFFIDLLAGNDSLRKAIA